MRNRRAEIPLQPRVVVGAPFLGAAARVDKPQLAVEHVALLVQIQMQYLGTAAAAA